MNSFLAERSLVPASAPAMTRPAHDASPGPLALSYCRVPGRRLARDRGGLFRAGITGSRVSMWRREFLARISRRQAGLLAPGPRCWSGCAGRCARRSPVGPGVRGVADRAAGTVRSAVWCRWTSGRREDDATIAGLCGASLPGGGCTGQTMTRRLRAAEALVGAQRRLRFADYAGPSILAVRSGSSSPASTSPSLDRPGPGRRLGEIDELLKQRPGLGDRPRDRR